MIPVMLSIGQTSFYKKEIPGHPLFFPSFNKKNRTGNDESSIKKTNTVTIMGLSAGYFLILANPLNGELPIIRVR